MISDNKNYQITLLLLIAVTVSAVTFPPTTPEIALHGRYYIDGASVKYDWTCFKIDFCFTNSTKVYWNVDDSWNIYHVILDESKSTKIQPKKSKKILVFESAQPESHCLQIVKIT
jgi:hypothetical protein